MIRAHQEGSVSIATNPSESSVLDGARVRYLTARLATDLQEVVELAYFEGLSSSEIADYLQVPMGTVKSRMARALASLRVAFGIEGGLAMSGDVPRNFADFFADEPGGIGRDAEEILSRWAATTPLASNLAARAPDVKHRLMNTLGGPDRFCPFFARLKAMVDLSLPVLREVLGKIDRDEGWVEAPFPSVRYLNFTPGPPANAQEGGLVRLTKGAPFPSHQHLGHEIACILEGVLQLGGEQLPPGSMVESAAGSTHEFFAGSSRDLVFIVVHNGVRF